MKLKFNTFGLVCFAVLCALFYWLCPAISRPVLRYTVYGVFLLVAFGACFVVVKFK